MLKISIGTVQNGTVKREKLVLYKRIKGWRLAGQDIAYSGHPPPPAPPL